MHTTHLRKGDKLTQIVNFCKRSYFFFQFETTVDAVVPVRVENGWNRLAWAVTTSDGIDPSPSVESRFDAVMVCNGFVQFM